MRMQRCGSGLQWRQGQHDITSDGPFTMMSYFMFLTLARDFDDGKTVGADLRQVRALLRQRDEAVCAPAWIGSEAGVATECGDAARPAAKTEHDESSAKFVNMAQLLALTPPVQPGCPVVAQQSSRLRRHCDGS